MTRPRSALAAVLCVLVALPAAAAAAPDRGHFRPFVSTAVSVAPDGSLSTGYSGSPEITPDGRWILFQSRADDLVPGDTNGEENWAAGEDVFLADTSTGAIERLSIGHDGAEPDERSSAIGITPDARYVTFSSQATNIMPGDTNGVQDVYRLDRATGAVELVSVALGGGLGDGHSAGGIMTPDGNTIVFRSLATNLTVAPNVDGAYDMYVRDMAAGTTEWLSSGILDAPTRGAPNPMGISDDGRLVLFVDSSNVYAGTSAQFNYRVFLHDRATGAVERVSTNDRGMDAEGPPGQLACPTAAMSGDARFVVMRCSDPNLVPNDTNGLDDVFVKDRATGRIERISLADDGRDIAWGSNPQISPDGRYVAFFSNAEVYGSDRPETGVKPPDLYLHDRLAGVTDPIFQRTEPQTGAQWSAADVSMTPGATLVAHVAPLVGIPGGVPKNVYLQERGEEVDVLGLEAARIGDAVEVGGLAAFAPQLVTARDRGTGNASATRFGAELRDVRIVARPEREDVFVSIGVDSLELAKAQEALPAGQRPDAVRYLLSFDLGDERHEVRVERTFDLLGSAPTFTLSQCATVCVEVGDLQGGFGTAGESIRFAMPTNMLAAESGIVSQVSVTTSRVDGVEETALDAINAPPGLLPRAFLWVDVDGEGAGPVTSEAGAFTGSFPAPAEPFTVSARACLGGACTTRSVDVD